jgi:hypothetical protein
MHGEGKKCVSICSQQLSIDVHVGIDGRIILKWFSEKNSLGLYTGFR